MAEPEDGMTSEDMAAVAERDQLWASLRTLAPAIGALAAGHFDGTTHQGEVVRLLARIVQAELEFRARRG